MATEQRPFRDEADVLYLHRDQFANMRITTTRPIGVACTVYRKEKVLQATKTEPDPAEVPRLDRMVRTGRPQPPMVRKSGLTTTAKKKAEKTGGKT